MDIIKTINKQPARKPLSLIEYAAVLQEVRDQSAGMTLEKYAKSNPN